MKKIAALFLCGALTALSLTGCSNNLTENPSSSAPQSSNVPPATSSSSMESGGTSSGQEAGGYKLGLAVDSTIKDSKSADAENGLAKTDSRIVAVLVDQDGRIVECAIDGVQTSIQFSSAGKLVTSLTAEFETKQELGPAYGMGKASSIGKEWNEQADALAVYLKGKNMDEVRGIAVNESGAPTDAELAASVTMSIAGYLDTVDKAIRYAVPTNAKAGDKLGVGARTTISKSENAGDNDGLAQANSTYVAAAFDGEGKVSGCVIDGSQCNVNFDVTGKITSDLEAKQKTKDELGAEYGLGKASGIGKEWNEQAAAYAAYITGKTVDEVKGIAVNEKGAPSGEELTSSVTISVGDFNTTLEKAASFS